MSQSKEFTMPSGAVLLVTVAPFEDANALKNAVLRALRGGALPDFANMELEDIKKNPAAIMGFVEKALGVATSEEVEACVFKCGARATYDNVRVTKALFDDQKVGQQAREDFYTICLKIAEVNVLPFFKSAFSGLRKPTATRVATPA